MKAKLNIKKIRRLMKASGIESQSELARRLGISRQLVSYTFKTQSLFRVYDFARFFKLDIKDLIE